MLAWAVPWVLLWWSWDFGVAVLEVKVWVVSMVQMVAMPLDSHQNAWALALHFPQQSIALGDLVDCPNLRLGERGLLKDLV